MFTCFYCSKQFSSKTRVKDHIVEKVCLKKEYQCWCGTACVSVKALQVHNLRRHAVRTKLNTTSLYFEKFSEFELWKQSIEEETLSKFVKPRTFSILKNGNKKTKYVCHRSGKKRLKTEERQRAWRKKGSCKLNAFCPAFISIEEDMHGVIRCDYYGTHNHTSEIQHLTLAQKDKERIAVSLNKGATFDEILDDVRNNSINVELCRQKRINFLTRKDLHNIMQEFKISFKERLARDATTVHFLVQECERRFGESSPLKLFKPQNVDGIEGMEGASPEDFILIIMTPAQKRILEMKEYNRICVDSSHGVKGFDFHLTTVSAINGSGISLPVAFCISNVVNKNIVNIFFNAVKRECGNLLTLTFSSKDFPIFINAWCEVMSIPERWQVDKNLQQNLQKMLISEVTEELDQIIRTLLRELDDQLLTPFMQNFVNKLVENESTKELANLFVNDCSGTFSKQPDDFRRSIEIRTNIKLEAMHRVLKDVYFKGLKVRRLDFSIFRLLKMAWDNLFERLIFLTKEKEEYTLKILKDRHSAGMLIPFSNITPKDQAYEVGSNNIEKMVLVEKETINCSCRLKCADCSTCLHIYSCSCVDFCVAGNICKHIHAVSQFEKNPPDRFLSPSIPKDINKEETLYHVVEPCTLEYESKNYISDAKLELTDALRQLSHLIQTNYYDTRDYERGAKFVQKAFNLFCDNSSSAGKNEISSYKHIESEHLDFLSEHLTNCDASIGEEATELKFQSEETNLMLIDDVVEEIVYVDMLSIDDSYS